jgi:hypothetical protein
MQSLNLKLFYLHFALLTACTSTKFPGGRFLGLRRYNITSILQQLLKTMTKTIDLMPQNSVAYIRGLLQFVDKCCFTFDTVSLYIL